MDRPREDGFFIKGICMSCKKQRNLMDFQGIKLCYECEEKFFEELIKLHESHEFGRDIVGDEIKKKKD